MTFSNASRGWGAEKNRKLATGLQAVERERSFRTVGMLPSSPMHMKLDEVGFALVSREEE